MTKICALIPLRGGSKSIPKKNIKILAGKPLCYWVLKAAHDSNTIHDVYVSTDDEEIVGVVNSLGLGTKIIRRPDELASDYATTESVMLHFMEKVSCDTLVTIQATSPLLKSEDLDKALTKLENEHLDSMVSGILSKRFFWSLDGSPLNYDPLTRPMRQDFRGSLVENGAFYITRTKILNKYKCRLGGKIGVYTMAPETEIELDEPEDWKQLETIIAGHLNIDIINNIKLLVCDIDGTMTDAGMYYSPEGELLKKFNTRDAHGIGMLKKNGVEVVFLTSEDSPIVISRAKKLGIKECHVGIKNKVSVLTEILKAKGLSFQETAYIGDDNNDLECLKLCGYSGCPADAHSSVLNVCNFISTFNGGRGAVREFCDQILNSSR